MSDTTDTLLLLRAFVDELVRCGMRAACTSPGSRNAPLVLALASEGALSCYSHVDERAAGFFALGWAKQSGLPVAVTCTSGTAAAELLPAAVEAREARVPLLLLTADRPAELRENGAGQAIDQLKMFGSAVKWFFEVELPAVADGAALRWIRTLACRAYATTLEGRPGAVHLNFPLREPLVDTARRELPADGSGRPGRRPFVERVPAREDARAPREHLRALLAEARRPLLVAGRDDRRALRASSGELAAAGWPLLADPMSGARRGPAAVAHYDALLRSPSFAAAMRPDLVVRAGDLPVSKPLRTWLASLDGVAQVALDPQAAWQDPDSVLSASLALDAQAALEELASAGVQAEEGWLAGWRSADERAGGALEELLGDAAFGEPAVARKLASLLDGEHVLFVASSMPVRDIETVWPALDAPAPVLCNRGANGIDGTVSSAFGLAASLAHAGAGEQAVLLIGDVALAHDIGGLLAAARLGLKLTIVLLNNDGGGIFDFLAVSRAPLARHDGGDGQDLYTRHVATPTGLDFSRAASLYGLEHERVESAAAFGEALDRALARSSSGIIEVPSERRRNVALHRQMWEAVAASLSR